jgi:hypothetical protein
VRREYRGAAQSARLTIALGGTTGDLTITCDDLTNWPTGASSRPFYVVIDRNTSAEEKILCASRSGNVITVVNGGRGADETSITAHSSNAVIEHVFTATDADEANSHVNDSTTDVHPQYVLETTVNAKGDLLVGTANDTVARLGVGTNGDMLVADSSTSTGLGWEAPTPSIAYAISALTGSVTLSSNLPGGSVGGPININWPTGRFSVAPVVMLQNAAPNAGSGSSEAFVYIPQSVSSSTAVLNVYNAGSFSTDKCYFNVLGIQMTSGSATG